jgi:hypothetical protein
MERPDQELYKDADAVLAREDSARSEHETALAMFLASPSPSAADRLADAAETLRCWMIRSTRCALAMPDVYAAVRQRRLTGKRGGETPSAAGELLRQVRSAQEITEAQIAAALPSVPRLDARETARRCRMEARR